MCNLYSLSKGQKAILELARAMRDLTGNLPPLPGIYPDYAAPIVRSGEDVQRELVMARWGMPTPPQFLEGKKVDKGVTNIRNVKSPHWRAWMAPEHRCLVPFSAFSEPPPGASRLRITKDNLLKLHHLAQAYLVPFGANQHSECAAR